MTLKTGVMVLKIQLCITGIHYMLQYIYIYIYIYKIAVLNCIITFHNITDFTGILIK